MLQLAILTVALSAGLVMSPWVTPILPQLEVTRVALFVPQALIGTMFLHPV